MAGRTQTTKLLGRQAILAATDIVTEDVEVPEWGGSVRVRGLSGVERDQYEAWIVQGKGAKQTVNLRNARAKLVMMSVIDDEGSRVFDEADIVALGKKSALAMQRVFDRAAALSGLDEDALEEMTGDLGNDPSGDSGSA